MFKNVIVALIALLFLGVGALYYLHFSSQKIVYVDSSRLGNSYQGMLTARKTYPEKAKVWQGNVNTMTNEVQQAIKDYEKESSFLTQKEKELSQELVRTKQRQLAEYQQTITDKAAQEDGQMTGQVLEQINAYIKAYGERKNCRIIIYATEYGNITYAPDGMDITDEVREELDSEYAG